MEEEFEAIEVEVCGDDEIDLAYEFDAPRFCDFTKAETFWDAVEAEQWFEYASSYPPSPFLLKLRWGNEANGMESEQVSANEDNDRRGHEYCNQTTQNTFDGNSKPLRKSSGQKSKLFTFMKPTASNLAKQKNAPEVESSTNIRLQKQNSSMDGQLTKRQKLEAGYLRKIARLKHQILFSHKKPKELNRTESNITIPKEPNLETALRAQRRKSRANAESNVNTQSSSHVLKARPLNKKILEGPAQSLPKMKTLRPTEFQEFHLKTSERAMQHASSKAEGNSKCNSVSNSETRDLKRTNSSVESRQEKSRMSKQLSSKRERRVFRNIKVFPMEPNEKRSLNVPPTEQLSKLSLTSEVKQTTKSPSKEQPIPKSLKENRPGSLHQEREKKNLVREEIQRSCGKEYQYVNEMVSLISKQTCMLELGR